MEAKRLIMAMALLVTLSTATNAQGWLGKLKEKATEKIKEKVENRVGTEVGNTTDDVLNGESTRTTNNQDSGNEEEVPAEPASKRKTAQGQEVKSDFVPGTVVIFEDNLQGEQMGEFPSKWDLIENNAEVARMDGKMAIKFEHGSDTEITPLLKDGNKKYLPEVFTLEFDFFVTGKEDHTSAYHVLMKPEDGDSQSDIFFGKDNMSWNIAKPNGDPVEGNKGIENIINTNDWNHFALSFNKRALKVYVNNVRIINIPNAKAMDWFSFRTEFWEDHEDFITNVRLAKGGVELYDRNAQDMSAVEKAIAETGKFVTNNILFETGKATLKPESMTEIEKVAAYMKQNPRVRFEVQGHTDNQGSDAINDPLSQQRAEAVVKALASLGVDDFNLKPVGKGSHEPVADNKTEAGRAKNRRVEFIKR